MTTFHDETYLNLLSDILKNGKDSLDRTKTGTKRVFCREMRFDISDGSIPLLTVRKIHTKTLIHELLWYLSGDTNIKYLQDNKVTIWDEWADSNGDLGPVYGEQWRKWKGFSKDGSVSVIDQIAWVINEIKTNPSSRRLLVSSWNVAELNNMKLPPCHYSFQFFVEGGKLSCLLNMRSNDIGLGNPYNIAQYSILTAMIAQVTGLSPGEFIWRGGDVHIYNNHITQIEEMLKRKPFASPILKLNKSVMNIDDFKFEDIEIVDYSYHPHIKMDVSV